MPRERSRLRRWGPPVVAFVIILALWDLVLRITGLPDFVLPSPLKIGAKVLEMRATLVRDAFITFQEALGGFVMGTSLGVLIAILFAHSRLAERCLFPYAVAFQTIPIVVLAPLLVLWFGNGLLSKVIIAAIISLFPSIVNTTKGLKSVDRQALDLMSTYAATRWQVFYKLRLPAALPFIFSALKISTTLCVIGAIVGEFVGANAGIGFIVEVAQYRLETDFLFAGIAASALTGIVFFLIVAAVEHVLLKDWHESAIPEEG